MGAIPLSRFRMTNARFQTGLTINEYNGTYSIAAAKSKDDGIFMEWSFPQRHMDGGFAPGSKALPHKIHLGNNVQEAIQVAEWIISQLKGDPEPQVSPGSAQTQEEPPF